MVDFNGARVLVAGAGALGSAITLELARGGAEVLLADPAALADNTSGVAAGLLAPAFETVLDPTPAGGLPLLRGARDLWPDLAGAVGGDIGLRRSGAVWIDLPSAPPRLELLTTSLIDLGIAADPWSDRTLRRAFPGLSPEINGGLFTSEDWRLEPRLALAALRRAAQAARARYSPQPVAAFERGRAVLGDGETVAADVLVLATGAAPGSLAPETAALSPIKGQILRFSETIAADDRPAIRCEAGYAVPARDGLRIGGTMEPGLSDRRTTAAAEPLGRLAVELFPALDGAALVTDAGVRAATPDGLPLVGPSLSEGVFLAVGARRNGWLLAPLVARMIAAYLAERDPGPFAGALSARRFAPA